MAHLKLKHYEADDYFMTYNSEMVELQLNWSGFLQKLVRG